jgi:uncharacterized protein (TIGR03083 family)
MSPGLPKEVALNMLQQDATALADAAIGRLDVPIPTCPGWFMVDLVVHVGGVHRAQAAIVRTRSKEPLGIAREMFDSVPGLLEWLESSTLFGGHSNLVSIPAGLDEWFRAGAEELSSALANADPTDTVWSWSLDQTVAHYLRLMPIETAVHRWDAQVPTGHPDPIQTDLATDGVSHTFEVMAPYRRQLIDSPPGTGESYLCIATDSGSTWQVTFEEGELKVIENPPKPSAAIEIGGSASELFLFLWGRRPVGGLQVAGDYELLSRYFQLVPPV